MLRFPLDVSVPARRAIALVMAAAFVAAGLGVLPSSAAIARFLAHGATSGAAYPCQDHGCGCASAAECWTACCCHAPVERLAWALEHGVQPPAFVRYTDEQWIAAANIVRPGSASCASCLVGVRASLARGTPWGVREGAPAPEACCAKAKPSPRSSLPCASAFGCKGQAPLILVAVPPAIAAREPEVRSESISAPPSCAAPAPFAAPVTRALDVPAPPPRRVA